LWLQERDVGTKSVEDQAQKLKWWQLLVHKVASSRPGVWIMSRTLHRVDPLVIRLSNGQRSLTSILSGRPVVVLTAIGAKSGLPRSVPLIGIEDGEKVVLIASNYGCPRNPGWYYNLCANPEASLSIRGKTRTFIAREADEEQRELYWSRALALFAGYAAYEKRTGGRTIPILVLTPKPD
jgi:deazaflavin-dependent oxidoreductase (nitroreductase family)